MLYQLEIRDGLNTPQCKGFSDNPNSEKLNEILVVCPLSVLTKIKLRNRRGKEKTS